VPFPSMSRDRTRDDATLRDLANTCSSVMNFVQGASRSDLDHNNQMRFACCYQIAVIGEAVKRLSPAIRDKYSEVPWRDIAGMRDG